MKNSLLKVLLLQIILFMGYWGVSANPVMPTISTAENEVWYYVKMKTGGGVLQDMGEGKKLLTKKPTEDNKAQLWKITQSGEDYILTNQLGRVLTYSSSFFRAGDSSPITFKLVPSTNASFKDAWLIQRSGGEGYLNQFQGQGINRELSEWDDQADKGSALEFVLPKDMDFPFPVTISTPDKEIWYYIRMKDGNGVLQDMGDGEKILTKTAEKDKEEQLWKITKQDGSYILTNQKGRVLDFSQHFTASTSGNAMYKIIASTCLDYDDSWLIERVGGNGYLSLDGSNGIDKNLTEQNNPASKASALDFVLPDNMSFFPKLSTPENEIWYYVKMKRGGGVIQDMGEGKKLLTKVPRKNKEEQLWKVTKQNGNYVLTNKKGRSLNFSSGRFIASSNNKILFSLVASTCPDYKGSWLIKRSGSSNYLNQNGGQGIDKELGEWHDQADVGSALEFALAKNILFPPESPDKEATLTGKASAPETKYSLWYRTPATDWMTQALPIGNGQFGGMIFGGVKQERIQFNDKTLWEGNATSYGAYQNFGSLYINTLSDNDVAKNYIRTLDIENAIATVEYESNGTKYKREYLASYPDSAIIVCLSSSQKGKLNTDIMLYVDHQCKNVTYDDNSIAMEGKLSLVSFAAKVEVKNIGGTMQQTEDLIRVNNADTIIIALRGKTNYSPTSPTFLTPQNNTKEEVASILDKVLTKPFKAIKNNHINDYKSLFNRCTVSLGTTSNKYPTDELIRKYATNHDKFLVELYFQFGRYLMISSARGMSLPSNLQGIWNNSNTPPWNADIHSNINVQENYWPAEVTNLSELHNTFLDYIYNQAIVHKQWQQNARDAGQSKGWVTYTENNIFGWHGGFAHNYVVANAWYCMHLWQHYRYTLDKDFLLNKAYPVMKSCSEFWMERLKKDSDGSLVCPNEFSPEHGPSEDGVPHAQQLVWDLFKNTLEAMDSLGTQVSTDADFKNELQSKFDKLDNGCHTEVSNGKTFLREWKYTKRETVGDYKHRHLSHLVGLYPGNQISPFIDKNIFDAAITSLDSRGDFSTGWAMGHRITCWARALDGNRAYKILNNAIGLSNGGGGIYTNLFDAHPPFQIDGNFAATAAIAEMLLQSHTGRIQLLPALPDAWANGSAKGLRAVGNFEIDIEWNNKKASTVTLKSISGKKCNIIYSEASKSTVIDGSTGKMIDFEVIGDDEIAFNTVAGTTYNVFLGESAYEKNTLKPGKYFIKVDENYLTNNNPNETGGAPVFSSKLTLVSQVLLQGWNVTKDDNGYYKIESLEDNRFINDNGEFGTTFDENMHTFNIYVNKKGECAIQNTQNAGSNYLTYNSDNNMLEKGDKQPSFVFKFVPYSDTGIKDVFEENNLNIMMDDNKINIIGNTRVEKISLFTMSGIEIRATSDSQIVINDINAGTYILKVKLSNKEVGTKKIVIK